MAKVTQLTNESWLVYWMPQINTENSFNKCAFFRIENREFTLFLQVDSVNEVFQLDMSVPDAGKNSSLGF